MVFGDDHRAAGAGQFRGDDAVEDRRAAALRAHDQLRQQPPHDVDAGDDPAGAHRDDRPAQARSADLPRQPLREQQDDQATGDLEAAIADHVDPGLGAIDGGGVHPHVQQLARGAIDRVGQRAVGDLHDAGHFQPRPEAESQRGQAQQHRLRQDAGADAVAPQQQWPHRQADQQRNAAQQAQETREVCRARVLVGVGLLDQVHELVLDDRLADLRQQQHHRDQRQVAAVAQRRPGVGGAGPLRVRGGRFVVEPVTREPPRQPHHQADDAGGYQWQVGRRQRRLPDQRARQEPADEPADEPAAGDEPVPAPALRAAIDAIGEAPELLHQHHAENVDQQVQADRDRQVGPHHQDAEQHQQHQHHPTGAEHDVQAAVRLQQANVQRHQRQQQHGAGRPQVRQVRSGGVLEEQRAARGLDLVVREDDQEEIEEQQDRAHRWAVQQRRWGLHGPGALQGRRCDDRSPGSRRDARLAGLGDRDGLSRVPLSFVAREPLAAWPKREGCACIAPCQGSS